MRAPPNLSSARKFQDEITQAARQERSVEQMTSLAACACVNVRIGEFMLGNCRTKLYTQCMLSRRGQFEGSPLAVLRVPALHLAYLIIGQWSE